MNAIRSISIDELNKSILEERSIAPNLLPFKIKLVSLAENEIIKWKIFLDELLNSV